MLRSVKYQNFTRNGLGSDKVGILRHVARSVHFSIMIDSLGYLDSGLRRERVATELASLVVVVSTVEPVGGAAIITFRKVHSGDLEIILCLTGRVSTQQETMHRVRLIRGPVVSVSDKTYEQQTSTYDSLSGNHWHVRLGQSSACVMTTSYK